VGGYDLSLAVDQSTCPAEWDLPVDGSTVRVEPAVLERGTGGWVTTSSKVDLGGIAAPSVQCTDSRAESDRPHDSLHCTSVQVLDTCLDPSPEGGDCCSWHRAWLSMGGGWNQHGLLVGHLAVTSSCLGTACDDPANAPCLWYARFTATKVAE
jgi:hypothetical protein